jgi:hypothetical protein
MLRDFLILALAAVAARAQAPITASIPATGPASAPADTAQPAAAPAPAPVKPGEDLEMRFHIRGQVGRGMDFSVKDHGGAGIGALFDGEAGGWIGGVQGHANAEWESWDEVETALPLEEFRYLGAYAGKAVRSRYFMAAGAMSVGRMWGTLRGDFLASARSCPLQSQSSCAESDKVTVRRYAKQEVDQIAFAPFVTGDFGFTRFFAVGVMGQYFLYNRGSLYVLTFVVRLGE